MDASDLVFWVWHGGRYTIPRMTESLSQVQQLCYRCNCPQSRSKVKQRKIHGESIIFDSSLWLALHHIASALMSSVPPWKGTCSLHAKHQQSGEICTACLHGWRCGTSTSLLLSLLTIPHARIHRSQSPTNTYMYVMLVYAFHPLAGADMMFKSVLVLWRTICYSETLS